MKIDNGKKEIQSDRKMDLMKKVQIDIERRKSRESKDSERTIDLTTKSKKQSHTKRTQ